MKGITSIPSFSGVTFPGDKMLIKFILSRSLRPKSLRAFSTNFSLLFLHIYVWIYENGAKELGPKTPLFHLDFTKPLGLLKAK